MRWLGSPATSARRSKLVEYAVVILVIAAIVVGAAWFLDRELDTGLGRSNQCLLCGQ